MLGRLFCQRAAGIRADLQGMPGARQLSFSFTAPPCCAVCSRGHIPAGTCVSTSHLSCPTASAFPSFSPSNRLSKSQTLPWQMPVQCGFLSPIPLSWTALPALSRVSPAALVPAQLSSGNVSCTQERESLGELEQHHGQALQGSQPCLPQYPPGLSPARLWAAVSPSLLGTESKQSKRR